MRQATSGSSHLEPWYHITGHTARCRPRRPEDLGPARRRQPQPARPAVVPALSCFSIALRGVRASAVTAVSCSYCCGVLSERSAELEQVSSLRDTLMCISDVAFSGDPAPDDRFQEQMLSWAAKRRRSRKRLGLDPAVGCHTMGLRIASAPAAAGQRRSCLSLCKDSL